MSQRQDLDKLKIIGNDPLREHREMTESFVNPMKELYGLTPAWQDPLKEHREMMKALVNPMKDLHGLTSAWQDPLKEHREMMETLVNPMKDLHGLTPAWQDPLKEHREMMEALVNPMKDFHGLTPAWQDPLKEHREMMETLVNPMKDLHGLTSSWQDPLKEHREMMEALVNPMKDLHRLTSSWQDPLKEHREMMAALVDPMKELRAMTLSFPDPLKEHREMMEAIANPMKQFQATMANIVDIDNLFQQNSSLVILKQMAEVELFDAVRRSTSVSEATINEISSEIFISSANAEAENLESLLNNILLEIKALKEPKLQQLIVSYIFPLILFMLSVILAPIADYHIKAYLQSDKRLRNKSVNEQVVSSVPDREVLNALRYVSADTLNVRAKPSIKSEILGYFHHGYVVTIIRKEKNWSLVEWIDQESELLVTGWVNTRYLKRFR
ncbi:TPA: SH3 domain-containing protein [Vibrio parahaemolyticus]|nr:SH3 domain-containing protein [Vibrio parahaemolyticus]